MPSTLTYTGDLVVTSCWCGIHVAIPDDLYKIASRNHTTSIYCPLGHTFVYMGETEAQKLKRQLQWERDGAARLRADLDQASKSLSATRGVVTKMRKRAIAGSCQFCHRNFANVSRHMASQHPNAAFDVEVP